MGGLLTLIGAAGFIGYLIWLVVCIRNWDSKIPPVIGMLLSVVMLLGGLAWISEADRPKENGSEGVSAEQEALKEETDAAPGGENSSDDSQVIWYVDYYLDNFQQPTDEWYITAPAFPGTSDRADRNDPADKDLSVVVRVNRYDEIAFVLYMKNVNAPLSTREDEPYYITMRTPDGVDHSMSGTMYSSERHLCIDVEYKSAVLDAMRSGGTISFYIESAVFQPENYLFSIDTDGFDSVYQSQAGG